MIYIASFSFISFINDVYPSGRPQIAKKAFKKIPIMYTNCTNVFSPDLGSKFSKYIKINNHAIELVYD